MIKESNSERETYELGFSLGAEAKPGEIYCLDGDLGAGKTVFAKGFAAGLKIDEPITSPTFTIVKEYVDGRLPLYHFDVYRVHSEEDLFEIGYEEYFFGNGVCFVEWADFIGELLPEKIYKVYLKYTEEDDGRMIRIEYPGD